jgi:hypothetical protein
MEGTGGSGGAGGSVQEGCLGDSGVVPACTGAGCSDGMGGVVAICPGPGNLKEGVRQQAIECLNALPAASCTTESEGDCISTALAAACADAAAPAICADITKCNNNVAIPSCESYFNGLTQAGQKSVVDCLNAAPKCDEATLQDCESKILN